MELTISTETDEVDETAIKEAVRIASAGEASELYKDAKETWVVYAVSICHPEQAGYQDTIGERGALFDEIHQLLISADGAPFTERYDRQEKEDLEEILERLEDKELVENVGERWQLSSSEPIVI